MIFDLAVQMILKIKEKKLMHVAGKLYCRSESTMRIVD